MTEGTREQSREGGGISHRAASWLAWSLWALTLVLTALSLLLLALNRSEPNVHLYDYWADYTLGALTFSTVGAFVASRRPENPIGWIFCALGLYGGVGHFAGHTRASGLASGRHGAGLDPCLELCPGHRPPGVLVPLVSRRSAGVWPLAMVRMVHRSRAYGDNHLGGAAARYTARTRPHP